MLKLYIAPDPVLEQRRKGPAISLHPSGIDTDEVKIHSDRCPNFVQPQFKTDLIPFSTCALQLSVKSKAYKTCQQPPGMFHWSHPSLTKPGVQTYLCLLVHSKTFELLCHNRCLNWDGL